jgi:hypothetical protein
MEYKFVTTAQGPVVQGEDEILFFSQFGQLLDYHDEDPEFLNKAKTFVADGLMELSAHLANSLSAQVIGADPQQALYGYINAVSNLKQFEGHYLPSVSKH